MRAIRIHAFGDAEQLRLEQIQKPLIEAGQVLVKIFDAGVNPFDYKVREGKVPGMKLPMTAGQDFCGEIMNMGEGVTDFIPGDKVFGFAKGTYADYAVANASDIIKLPVGMSEEVAAALPTAGLTAWQVVMEEAKVDANHRVLIHGAAGGVGSIVIQLCHWLDAYVIANAALEDKDYVMELGADEFIDYHSQKFEEVVQDVDIVIDLVGGETYKRSFDILKTGGTLVSTVIHEGVSGASNFKVIHTLMRKNMKNLAGLADLVERGIINIKVEEILPMNLASRAQDILQHEHHRGKTVLKIAS